MRIVTSVVLAKSLNDIGVNEETIQMRRSTSLYIEALVTVFAKTKDSDADVYIFGSQSEGTTTKGMHSDVDFLIRDNVWSVIQDFTDWQFGRRQLFVVTDVSTPPQCCFLQRVLPNYPKLWTEELSVQVPGHHMDAQGRVFLKNTLFERVIKSICDEWGLDFFRHGPSLTLDEKVDMVHALHCAKLPEDCQYIFRRPKPGHWPRPTLLTQLKDSGVFLVPIAHVENTTHWDPRQHLGTLTVRTYDNSHELYWRLSTNLIERLLMFDLTMTQTKVYVVMKIIRKEFCKPLVGDRLSTFHLKTALLYSVEMSPPCVWEDENLIQCLKLCLTTLRRWLKVRYCPHYTTENVNLFAGKLRWNEFPVLIELFTVMIRNDLTCLYNVIMDDIGSSISSNSTDSTGELPFEELDMVVAKKSFKHLLNHLFNNIYRMNIFGAVDTLKIINDLEIIYKTSTGKICLSVSSVLPFYYSIHAAMKASQCIGQNERLPQEIFTLFDKSLTSDVTSSRLRLATIYFSFWRVKDADAILKQVEALISNKVMAFSPFKKSNFRPELLELRKELPDILQNYIALCTIFTRKEMNCFSGHLVAEFYRTVTVEDADCRNRSCFWMDSVVIDSITYMYYLQYFTSRHTGIISDKHSAFKNLQDRVFSDRDMCIPNTFGHIETSLNLLGHCWELEGVLPQAWRCYMLSVAIEPQNNAAYWHMFTMIGRLIYWR